jgi:hypothetical protein
VIEPRDRRERAARTSRFRKLGGRATPHCPSSRSPFDAARGTNLRLANAVSPAG